MVQEKVLFQVCVLLFQVKRDQVHTSFIETTQNGNERVKNSYHNSFIVHHQCNGMISEDQV